MPVAEPLPCRVILLGMMGTGKSSVGRELSRRLGWPFVDNDVLVEAETGLMASELAIAGEANLRTAETQALHAALAQSPPLVVALAAGTILEPANRAAIARAGLTVWLRAEPSVMAERTAGTAHRPWLGQRPEGWLRETDAARAPLYAEVAELTFRTDAQALAEITDAIIARLRLHGCAPAVAPR